MPARFIVSLCLALLLLPSVLVCQGMPQSMPPAATDTLSAPPANSTDAAAPARFRPSDLWATFSRARWHSFSLYSFDVEGGYSNYPVASNPGFFNPQLGSRQNLLFIGSASMGFAQRWTDSDLAITYTPHFYEQSRSNFNSITHNAALNYRHGILRRWDLGFHARAATANQYSTLNEGLAGASAPLLSNGLIGNENLLTVIAQPAQISSPYDNLVLGGYDVLSTSAGVNLTGNITGRTRVVFDGSFGWMTDLGALGSAQRHFLARDTRSRIFTAGIERDFTRHYRLGLRYVDLGSRSDGFLRTQREVQATLGWLPVRHWAVFVAAGPALRSDGDGRNRADVATQLTVSRATTTSVFSFMFQRDLYVGGLLPGGIQAHNAMFEWSPRPRHRHWMISLNSGYSWLEGHSDHPYSTSGWLVQPVLGIPITRSLQFYTQYSYFSRRVSAESVLPLSMGRHSAVVGLRWSFLDEAPPRS